MAGVQELPLQVQVPHPIQRREGPYHFLALLGASLVVLSVVVVVVVDFERPVQAGYALAGFLIWLTGMARLLLFGQIGQQRLFFPAELAAATARVAVEKTKRLFFGRQAPVAAPA